MITPSFGLTATERVLPKLALDFTTASLDSRVTFTRTTDSTHPATYVNSSGYITAATNNQPRFDYDPVTLACKGLLIEESRTNLLTYSIPDAGVPTGWSVGFATGSYTHTLVTGSPLLVNQNMIKNEQTVSGRSPLTKAVTLSTSTTYTLTVYVDLANTTATGDIVAVTNFTGATFTTTYYKSKADADSSGRITIVFTTAADATGTISIGIGATGNDTGVAVVGGWQLEAGAFATSYIPTTTTALTRNADVATMTGTNFSDWYNQSEGTFVATFILNTVEKNSPVVEIADVSNNRQVLMGNYSTAARTRFIGYSGGSSVTDMYPSTPATTNTIRKVAVALKTNNNSLGVNGVESVSDLSSTLPNTMTQVLFGNTIASSAQQLNGYVQKFYYYPLRLTNTEVLSFSKV